MADMDSRKRPTEGEDVAGNKRVVVDSEGPVGVAVGEEENGQEGVVAVYGEQREDRLTLKTLILSKDVGAIIGKGGTTIKAIRDNTGCRVIISESVPNTNERILTVTGTPATVRNAYGQIVQRLYEESSAAAQQPVKLSLNLLVASSQIGPVIGKGGSKIREIRESTGTHVSVATEQLPGSTERTVTVSGTAEAVSNAIAVIGDILYDNPPKGTVVAFRPQARLEQLQVAAMIGAGQQPQSLGYAQYGSQSAYSGGATMGSVTTAVGGARVPRGTPDAPGPGETTQIVTIPNEYIGAIIGKGGAKINEIRSLSTTRIKITDAVPGSLERQVILTGTPEACQTACYMLNSRLQQEIARRQALI